MALLTSLRRLSRTLPVAPHMLHRLRRLAGHGFAAAAWLTHGRGRRPGVRRAGPVCVVGFHASVLGIGEAARAFSASLRTAGAEVIDWDISARFGHEVNLEGGHRFDAPEDAAAFVMFLNPRELVQLMAMTGGKPFKERFCVGAWAWELEAAPPSWRAGFRYVDEVWACSGFVAESVAARAPRDFPIRILPHPVKATGAAPDRARFGLPSDKVVVLTAFDVRSGLARKNPLAAVRVFRRANTAGRAVMVCKGAGLEGAPDQIAALRAEIGDAGDVRFMSEWLTGAEMGALVASADIVLSLHRSEGFGLLPAQAMAAGKAVAATGWSGNLQYMTPDDSALVGYTLIPVTDPQGLYDGGRWAEPDMAAAAAALAALIADAGARAALGRRAAAAIAGRLDPLILGRTARDWLEG